MPEHQPDASTAGRARTPPAPGMRWIPGGEFLMGSADFYPEEAPVRRVAVDGLWADETPVTVAAFAAFVEDTGHVTDAEVAPDAAEYPGADPDLLVPGSLVFRGSEGPVDLRDVRNWWAWTPGATWRSPEGPGSTVAGREDHPVTQVSYRDAEAYAAWAGKALPTEAEWERAARGGLESAVFAWGDEFRPGGRHMANTWQGRFPYENLAEDGHTGTSPVGSYPPNGFGLADVTGNVWEWTTDFFALPDRTARPCCVPRNPRVTDEAASVLPGETYPRRVIKGGSHLCAPSYCLRYRPAARQSESVESATSHLGFRCVVRAA
ncbi:MAG TPA: formylglycine-generating enzyme family protein [Miltoncostaeaceae bacterium]|nr:formylglycine-generating enzyme family protein [Miltoncostaeaceae bacterium]